MRLLVLALIASLAFAVAAPSQAAAEQVELTLRPARDTSFPFWCDWGWDWEYRCPWDDSVRLLVGGDADKVWRPALEFSLAALPRDGELTWAVLGVWFDGGCLTRGGGRGTCSRGAYSLEAWSIIGKPWFEEREVELGDLVASDTLETSTAQFFWLDVTPLVQAWIAGDLPNLGVLLKLADGEEGFGGGGPSFTSANGDASAAPVLALGFEVP
jgi:hypothetical protein